MTMNATRQDMSPPAPSDRELLRDLARRVADIASTPEQRARKAQALAINRLTAERPSVLVIPEGAWPEVLREEDVQCRDAFCRGLERGLRHRLIHHEFIGDDTPVDDLLLVGAVGQLTDWGVTVAVERVEARGSYHWDPPLKNLDGDLRRLRRRRWIHDPAASAAQLAWAQDVFGDILTVAPAGRCFWTMGLTWDAIRLYGLEPFMMAMYDDPAGLHRLMAFLRDDLSGVMDDLEAAGVLHSCNSAEDVGSGGIGLTADLPSADPREAGYRHPVGWRQRWGFAESQETVSVSPEMFAEFVLPYQLPLASRCGLNCYGCCEGLERRIEHVLRIPRLRRVSVSAWADRAAMAARLGRAVVYSRKPNPAHVCVGFNEAEVRREFRETLAVAGGCVVEFILKDTHTVEGEAGRFPRFVKVAREEIARHYGD